MPCSILIVEDDASVREVMEDVLSSIEGWDITSLPDAVTLPDTASGLDPSLILLDVNLPGIDGIAAYRLLRSHAETRHIPVLFVTAQSNRVKQANLSGWYDCIEKPFDIDTLIGRVAAIVGAPPGSL